MWVRRARVLVRAPGHGLGRGRRGAMRATKHAVGPKPQALWPGGCRVGICAAVTRRADLDSCLGQLSESASGIRDTPRAARWYGRIPDELFDAVGTLASFRSLRFWTDSSMGRTVIGQ